MTARDLISEMMTNVVMLIEYCVAQTLLSAAVDLVLAVVPLLTCCSVRLT